jgi:hypothetical protein
MADEKERMLKWPTAREAFDTSLSRSLSYETIHGENVISWSTFVVCVTMNCVWSSSPFIVFKTSIYILSVSHGRSQWLSAGVLEQMFDYIHLNIICLFFFVSYLDWMQMWLYAPLNCYLVHWSFHFFICCLSAVVSSLMWVIGTVCSYHSMHRERAQDELEDRTRLTCVPTTDSKDEPWFDMIVLLQLDPLSSVSSGEHTRVIENCAKLYWYLLSDENRIETRNHFTKFSIVIWCIDSSNCDRSTHFHWTDTTRYSRCN